MKVDYFFSLTDCIGCERRLRWINQMLARGTPTADLLQLFKQFEQLHKARDDHERVVKKQK
jgi:hypothetical protein